MEMSLTTDQLCAKARYRERENVWFRWIAAAFSLGFGAAFVYGAMRMGQVWMRLGLAWMAVLMALLLLGSIRLGSIRVGAADSGPANPALNSWSASWKAAAIPCSHSGGEWLWSCLRY